MDEIVDSMPTPSGVYFGAKLTALLLVIAVLLLAGVLALVGFQLARGYTDLEPGLYARGVALAAVYPILMMVLACFCHVVARNRLAGYGLVILFIISLGFPRGARVRASPLPLREPSADALLRLQRLRTLPRAVRLVQPLLGVRRARAGRAFDPVLEEGHRRRAGGRDGPRRAAIPRPGSRGDRPRAPSASWPRAPGSSTTPTS